MSKNEFSVPDTKTLMDGQPQTVSILFGLRVAMRTFAVQRLRSIFAMLGVFLGALLLTGICHILGAVSLLIEEQARAIGSHIITVSAERPSFSRSSDVRYAEEEEHYKLLDMAATLTLEDMQAAIEKIPYVKSGVPFITLDGWIFHGRKSSSCSLLGVTPGYYDMHSVVLSAGRFYNDVEEDQAALVGVLGNALAHRLFGEPGAAVGEFVRIGKVFIRLVGVMAPKGANISGMNMDEVVLIPARTAMKRFSSQDHVAGFFLEMQSRASISLLSEALENLLRTRHRLTPSENNDFSINLGEQVEYMVVNAMDLMTTLGLIGAGISFFVGSFGIFSIMILMVHARKIEIGIRRAVGAPRRLIMQQFLFEAGLMAGIGGILGVITALLFVQLISLLSPMPSYLNMSLSFVVCLLSVGCGVIAGGYPAWKASKIEVLAALRN